MDISKHHFNTFFSQRLLASTTPHIQVRQISKHANHLNTVISTDVYIQSIVLFNQKLLVKRQICNRNTLKLSYKCTPNISTLIAGRNEKLLSAPQVDAKKCSCTKNNVCPLDGKCLSKNVVYKATVSQENGTSNNYIGLSSNSFKSRLSTHKSSFNNIELNQTGLSKHIHELKNKNIHFELKWEIVDQAKPFSPVSGICSLCTREKFFITFRPEWSTLNKKSEIYASCRHRRRMLLNREKLKVI